MTDEQWEWVRREYEQAHIGSFFNLQDYSIGDRADFHINQTRWFREHGANLCHTLTEELRSDREFLIGTGIDPNLFKPAKKKMILVECGIKGNRENTDRQPPTISLEVINKALPEFQSRGYQVVVCGDNLDDAAFSFKPDRKFHYSTHQRFAHLMSEACVYVAANESYGLTLAEAQMAGTVLVLMKGSYQPQVILTNLFSEYEPAEFQNSQFVQTETAAKSMKAALEAALQITREHDYSNEIRHSVLKEFDYREQAKRIANVCLALGNASLDPRPSTIEASST